jgi:CubicO group peptidase (beta-lactamase class C family)
MRLFTRTGATCLLWALAAPAFTQNYLDDVVEHARKEFNVPGIAVVVKDGKVVSEKGYGVRRLGDAAPVTPHTSVRHRLKH